MQAGLRINAALIPDSHQIGAITKQLKKQDGRPLLTIDMIQDSYIDVNGASQRGERQRREFASRNRRLCAPLAGDGVAAYLICLPQRASLDCASHHRSQDGCRMHEDFIAGADDA
jgi:hypothetical protein